MTDGTCTLPGCDKPSRNVNAPGLCKMHYHRRYRHGSTSRVATTTDVTVTLGRRYRTISDPDHPLAMKSGRVYEHRAVLFDAIGYGPHPCHWCGALVDWLPKAHPDELQPDHLNNDGGDNRLCNLVPACRSCNNARGAQRRAGALREAGWWSKHDTVARLRRGGRRPAVGVGGDPSSGPSGTPTVR